MLEAFVEHEKNHIKLIGTFRGYLYWNQHPIFSLLNWQTLDAAGSSFEDEESVPPDSEFL